MPIHILNQKLYFPPVSHAEPDGLLAIGGDLSIPRLTLAYRSGIFPWYSEGYPILWYSPDPRMLLKVSQLRVNRSLRKAIRKRPYTLTLDRAFPDVIRACARMDRPGQDGTWITQEMERAYIDLHRHGLAHSVEAWQEDRLVGGLYGVCIGGIFCGESMFARADNASKIAFVALVRQLERWDIQWVDCQVHTPHLERFGATLWPRKVFMEILHKALEKPTRQGPWTFDQPVEEDVPSST